MRLSFHEEVQASGTQKVPHIISWNEELLPGQEYLSFSAYECHRLCASTTLVQKLFDLFPAPLFPLMGLLPIMSSSSGVILLFPPPTFTPLPASRSLVLSASDPLHRVCSQASTGGGNCIVSQSGQRNNVGCGKVKVFGGRGPVRRSPGMFWQRRRERGLLRLANLTERTTGYATLIIITTMTPPTTRTPFSARHRHPSRSRVEEALPPRLRCRLGLDS
jgi:hypothetical protein